MRRLACFLFVLGLVGVPAAADLSNQRDGVLEVPFAVLLTPSERESIDAIDDDASRARFMALFWARRDPDLQSPVNEFRVDFESRVAAADRSFEENGVRGALTARGKVLLVLGPPDSRRRVSIADYIEFLYNDQLSGGSHSSLKGIGPVGGSFGPELAVTDMTRDVAPTARFLEQNDRSRETLRHGVRFDLDLGVGEIWSYGGGSAAIANDVGPFEVVFFDNFGTGEYSLQTDLANSHISNEILARAPEALVTSPNLESPPNHPLLERAPPAAPSQLKALDVPGHTNPPDVMFYAMRGVNGDGSFPAWIHVELPAELPVPDRIAGRLTSLDAAVAGTFQLPVTHSSSDHARTQIEFELPAPHSSSVVELVLLTGQQVIAGGTLVIDDASGSAAIPYIAPFVAGTTITDVSGDALSDPFVFGGNHLRLRPDGRYARSESLRLFCLLADPAQHWDGPPKVRMSLRLVRLDDSVLVHSVPEWEVAPVHIASGIYMIGFEMPLERLDIAGPHRLELSVHDAATGAGRESSLPISVGSL